jgi:hypothetical protein
MKEIAGRKNRSPPTTRSERRAASPMGQVRSPTPNSSPTNWAYEPSVDDDCHRLLREMTSLVNGR